MWVTRKVIIKSPFSLNNLNIKCLLTEKTVLHKLESCSFCKIEVLYHFFSRLLTKYICNLLVVQYSLLFASTRAQLHDHNMHVMHKSFQFPMSVHLTTQKLHNVYLILNNLPPLHLFLLNKIWS